MRKLLSFFAFMLGFILLAGCSSTQEEPTPLPEPPTPDDHITPEIELIEIEVTAENYTFEIKANKPCEYGYFYMSDLEGGTVPAMPEWFNINSGNVEDSAFETLDNLEPNTSYKLYVAARSIDDGEYSAVKTMNFTTLDDGKFKAVQVTEIGTDYISFDVNLTGNFVYTVFESVWLPFYGTAENYLQNINTKDFGPKSITWSNGEI